ncbi:MAG: hypothetical protein KGS45_12820 [Planctomycetes bacterium]|nr:hypothetical protein [Planctomycetota bacterium]
MSHPYERPPIPITNLTAEDHALLAHIADEQFALRHVVGNSIHLHPAQQTLLTLTQWLKLAHIAAAARELQADLREYESVRLEFLQRHSIDGLVDAMHSASRNLKLLEESRTHNIQHTRAVEELRLAAQALNRATKPGATAPSLPSPGGSAPGGTGLQTGAPFSRSASRATDSSSTQSDSSSSLHREAVQVNSRGSSAKPTPPENAPSISTRSPDAQTCDDSPRATDPLGGQCDSASSPPRSVASDEPGVATPGTEPTTITPPPSSPSTEGAALTSASHSATAPLCHSATSLPSLPPPDS